MIEGCAAASLRVAGASLQSSNARDVMLTHSDKLSDFCANVRGVWYPLVYSESKQINDSDMLNNDGFFLNLQSTYQA